MTPSSFVGAASFDKTRSIFSQDIPHSSADHLSTLTCESTKGATVTSKQTMGVGSKLKWIVVVSTVIPSFFVAIDSFDKTRSSFLLDSLHYSADHFSTSTCESTKEGTVTSKQTTGVESK
jgi:hypothetical protein